MKRLVGRFYWFKGALLAGILLALLLLVQSITVYTHVSTQIINDQSVREAERQVAAMERELRTPGSLDLNNLKGVLDDTLQEGANKIAWIRILDLTGHVLAQSGQPAEQPPAIPIAKGGTPGDRGRPSHMSEMAGRKVMVSILPLRLRRGRPPSPGGPAQPGPQPGAPQGPRLVEMAIYLDSVAAPFWPLRRNLILNLLAALGLAGSMILLWTQFPRYMRGKQLEQQLELAHRVQTDLLPSANPTLERLDVAASCIAAQQVGGDFYDVFLTDRERIALVLGDVSGKGIPAALLMGLLHGAVRSMSWSDTAADHESSTRRLNDLLNVRTSPDRFASLFWAYYDPKTQVVQYVNAGHLPPALMRRIGDGEFQIQRLDEGGPILGAMPDSSYRQGQAQTQAGDLLILYSDGIVEARDAQEEEFGEERLWALARDNWHRSASEIRDEILRQVRGYLSDQEPQDDMTLVVVRVGNGSRTLAGAGQPRLVPGSPAAS